MSDRFEQERREFFERVRNSYLERARSQPGRFAVIDATADRESVQHGDPRRSRDPLVHAPMTETSERSRCRSCCHGTKMPLHSCARHGQRTALARTAAAGCGGPGQAVVRSVARVRGAVRQVARRRRCRCCGECASCTLFVAGSHPDLLLGRARRGQAADLHRPGARGHRASDEDELSAGLQGRDRRSGASDDAERREQRAQDARGTVAANAC